jgi:hypothetical protein
MGIELIEQSDMTALAPSRIGNKSFVNDDDNWAYGNGRILGIKLRGKKWDDKQRATTQGESVAPRYELDPSKQNDCQYLISQLTDIQNNIEAELGSNPSKARLQSVVGAYRTQEAKYKTLISNNKCADAQAAAENKKAQQEIIGAIDKASADTPQGSVGGTSTKSKYLYYGIGGIVAIVLLVVVVKKLKK